LLIERRVGMCRSRRRGDTDTTPSPAWGPRQREPAGGGALEFRPPAETGPPRRLRANAAPSFGPGHHSAAGPPIAPEASGWAGPIARRTQR